MKSTLLEQPQAPRSRRRVGKNGLPFLAAQLPPDFRSPTNVNAFIYSLTTEVTAGRVKPRTAAVLGYLSQLAIQTLPLLRAESEPPASQRAPFHFITHIPRPEYPDDPETPSEPIAAEQQ